MEKKPKPTIDLLRECTVTTCKELLEILVDVNRTDVLDDIVKFYNSRGSLSARYPTQESLDGDSSASSLSWPLQDSGHERLEIYR